jgi:hypothetical protein
MNAITENMKNSGVSIRTRLHPLTDSSPADRSRVDAPSLEGEASHHKGNFGKQAWKSMLPRVFFVHPHVVLGKENYA